MASGAAAAPAAASGGGGGGAGNPFQLATNLYAEKNNQGVSGNSLIGANQFANGGNVNAGQYLRALRLIVRTTTVGTTFAPLVGATGDFPWNVLTGVDLVNVDGSEILYTMGGYAHYIAQKYSRPWLGDPATAYDAFQTTAISPQFTLTLQPEIRWSAGVLANTDTRSQYRFDYVVDTATNIAQGGTATGPPTVNVQPYMDAWAQPDATDLQGTPNQPVPPGLNLQMKRRHQFFTLNPSGSDNILQSALTGNALRLQLLVTRLATNTVRIDGLSDPLLWQIDNRSLGKYSTQSDVGVTTLTGGDMIAQRMADFYNSSFFTQAVESTAGPLVPTAYSPPRREIGVYAFPRFIKPGELYGEGWLYTANSTKEIFESTSTAAVSGAATAELISDEVYPVGPISADLTDI